MKIKQRMPYSRPVLDPPAELVTGGIYNWGTFNGPVPLLNPEDAARPFCVPVPRAYKKYRIKEWEAFQAGDDRYFVLGAVYNAKAAGLLILSVFEIETENLYHYQHLVPPWKTKIGSSMIMSETSCRLRDMTEVITNDLRNGTVRISAECRGSKKIPSVRLDITAYHETEPIVISQPFSDNRGLYSHKALMPMDGSLTLGDRCISFMRDRSFTIVDDHKGYYPGYVSYDWITAAGFTGKGILTGFNCTRNQVRDPERFNENCLWHEGRMYPLPPIVAEQTGEGNEVWRYHDSYGMVDVRLYPRKRNRIKFCLPPLFVDYDAPYGPVEGHILKPDGTKIIIDGLFGMAEKKRYRL